LAIAVNSERKHYYLPADKRTSLAAKCAAGQGVTPLSG
jgi:hypothetical protein